MIDPIQAANRDFYDKYGELSATFRSNAFYLEVPFRKFIKKIPEQSHVIDIGCAHGIHVPLFLGIGRYVKYEGFDISWKMLEIAHRRYPQLPFRLGNILEKADLPNKQYAGFWAGAIFQHIQKEEWPTLLAHVESITTPGGLGFFSMPFNRMTEASTEDTRQFTIFPGNTLGHMLRKRGWMVLERGSLDGSRRSKHWRWYIVRLP